MPRRQSQRRTERRGRPRGRIIFGFGTEKFGNALVPGSQVLDVFEDFGRRLVAIGRFAGHHSVQNDDDFLGHGSIHRRGSGRGFEMCEYSLFVTLPVGYGGSAVSIWYHVHPSE